MDAAKDTPPDLHSDLGLHGDALEAVLTRLPSLDLIPASRVSPEWRTAVHSSLCLVPRRTPWLLLCILPHPNSPRFSVHAFDPFSATWLSPTRSLPSSDGKMTFLWGSAGDRLYTFSISKILISKDPFGTMWCKEVKAPKLWRQDAVVTEVGRWLVVAGGGFPMVQDENEEVGAVEVYDKNDGTWTSAEPMPQDFGGSTSAKWLSVAASHEKLYVVKKKTGLVCWFDLNTKRWGPAWQLRLEPIMSAWAIAIGRVGRVLLVGVGPACQWKKEVRLWEVNLLVADNKLEEEMPREMVDRLFPIKDEDDMWQWQNDDTSQWHNCSVEVCGTERGGYVYNPSEMGNGAVLYEFAEEEGRIVERWEWVPLPERLGESGMSLIEFGCSEVGLNELALLGGVRRGCPLMDTNR